jgi:DNA mismatch repair ATPase MutS
MFQYGFFIPAKNAVILIADEIILSLGEDIPEFNGLSSFAAEIMNINKILVSIKSGNKVFALIDELARTTNPDEGRSIVNAMIDILKDHSVCSVITTHYNGIQSKCNKLKVKGLNINEIYNINFNDINRIMDYRLIPDDSDEVAVEAIRIAEIMGVDKELTEKAKWYFNSGV